MFSRLKIQQILAVTILGVSMFGLFGVEQAWALPDIAANRVKIQTADSACTETPGAARGNPAGDNVWSAWASDPDEWDPDCVRVWISSALEDEVDIQVCIQTSDGTLGGSLSNTACTPWATEVDAGTNGWSPWAADPDKWAYDSIRIKVNTRAMTGRRITNYRLGFENSWAQADICGQGVGTIVFTYPMKAGGGWSAWATDGGEGSLACSRIKLDTVEIEGLPCTFNGSPVNSGSSVSANAAPSVPNGSTCLAPQTRTCTNGVLSGTYAYPNPPACYVQAQTAAPTGVAASCTQGTGAVNISWANSGATNYLSGIYNMASCPAGWTQSGSICYRTTTGFSDSLTVPINASYTAYVQQYTASGGWSPATNAAVTCNPYAPVSTLTIWVNGISAGSPSSLQINPTDAIALQWSGTNSPTSCTGTNFTTTGVSGTQNTVTEPTPGNQTTYSVTCTNNGGTSPADSIIVNTRAYQSCSRDTTSGIAHGSTAVFYSQNPLPYNTTCGAGNPYAATLTCNDGSFGGAGYPYSCHIDTSLQPAVFNSNGLTGTIRVRPGAFVPLTWNGVNASGCSLTGSGGFVSTSTVANAKVPSTAISGTAWVQINQKSAFTLTCNDAGGAQNSQAVTISLVPTLIEI